MEMTNRWRDEGQWASLRSQGERNIITFNNYFKHRRGRKIMERAKEERCRGSQEAC
jgi:hypothetical protein